MLPTEMTANLVLSQFNSVYIFIPGVLTTHLVL
jgi:hypothetical protein